MFESVPEELILHGQDPNFVNNLKNEDESSVLGSASAKILAMLSAGKMYSKQQAYGDLISKKDLSDPETCILLATTALASGDQATASKYLKIAASNGSIKAMNMLGDVYSLLVTSQDPKDADDSEEDRARVWFRRAAREGSVDAIRGLAESKQNSSNPEHDSAVSDLYYLKYIGISKSVWGMKLAAEKAKENKNEKFRKTLIAMAAENGDNASVKEFQGGEAAVAEFDVLAHPQLVDEPPEIFSKVVFENNFTLPSAQAALSVCEMIESAHDTENTKKFIRYTPTEGMINDAPRPSPTIDSHRLHAFPSTNRSQLLITAFDLASPSFQHRNLSLCRQVLLRVSAQCQHSIMDSRLFKNRVDHGTADQQLSCGFIAYLLNYKDLACEIWNRASIRGSTVAACMMGIHMFHKEDVSRTERSRALCLFAKCYLDPVAQAHLGVACRDDVPLERGARALGLEPDEHHRLFEWVGDQFSDGVKYPADLKIATMFWVLAIKQAKKMGKSTEDLVEKLSMVCG